MRDRSTEKLEEFTSKIKKQTTDRRPSQNQEPKELTSQLRKSLQNR